MKLWLISQREHNGWDTFDSAVVAAKTEKIAKTIHPKESWDTENREDCWKDSYIWASSPDAVTIVLLGNAKLCTKEGVILASFNAG